MDNLTIDVAYSYLKEESVKVQRLQPVGSSYNAKYKNSANGFAVGNLQVLIPTLQ
jgi:long-chain fatty acid transport protein